MFTADYKNVIDKYEDFWERTNDRPILNFSYKKDGYTNFPAPKDGEEKYLDKSYRYNAYKHKIANTGYIAEGIPMLFPDFGPGCLAACIGGSYKVSKETIWFDSEQFVKDWDNPPSIRFDEQSDMWQRIEEAQRFYASDPDVHFCMTDLGGVLDVVAALRGTENLLYDLYDYPDEVKEFSAKVTAEWLKSFDKQVEIIKAAGQPYNGWMNLVSKKPYYPLQCDFCYMISPAQFEEFVLDDLVTQTNYMERSIYHLDGPGELVHVDMLTDIENLTGIQWTSGVGNPSLRDECWYDLYRKVQDKKKNLVLLGGVSERDLEGSERLVKSLDPTGVYITASFSSKAKAEDMIEKIIRWTE